MGIMVHRLSGDTVGGVRGAAGNEAQGREKRKQVHRNPFRVEGNLDILGVWLERQICELKA